MAAEMEGETVLREIDLRYKRDLGLEFVEKVLFVMGVGFPKPHWYEQLSGAKKTLWYLYRKLEDLLIILLFLSNAVILILEYEDIRVLTTTIGTMMYIICLTTKLLVFKKLEAKLKLVLDHTLNLSQILDDNPVKNQDFFKIHTSFMKHVKIYGIGKSLGVLGMVITLIMIEVPLNLTMAKQKRNIPMSGWFPFDIKSNEGFVSSSVFQVFAYLSFLERDVALDLLFLTILVSFNTQLIYLRQLLELIVKDSVNHDAETRRGNYFWWIKQHQLVLRTIDDFKILSNPYLFVKYISVAIILFLGGVLVTSNVVYDPIQQVVVLAINSSNLFQLYIFSIMGDQITDNALIVADGGFNIELLTDKRDIKTLYLFSLSRAKKSVNIYFGNINPLCVHSFGQIVKMTFSYFTTILQIRADSES